MPNKNRKKKKKSFPQCLCGQRLDSAVEFGQSAKAIKAVKGYGRGESAINKDGRTPAESSIEQYHNVI